MDKYTWTGHIAAVGTDCNQAYITIEDTAGTAGLQRFCGNVLSDTNDDTTAGAVTSKYLTAFFFETGAMPMVRFSWDN